MTMCRLTGVLDTCQGVSSRTTCRSTARDSEITAAARHLYLIGKRFGVAVRIATIRCPSSRSRIGHRSLRCRLVCVIDVYQIGAAACFRGVPAARHIAARV